MAFGSGLLLSDLYPDKAQASQKQRPIIKVKALVRTTPSETTLIGVYNPEFTQKLLSGYLVASVPIDDSEFEIASIIPASKVRAKTIFSNLAFIISPLIKDQDLKRAGKYYEIHY